MQDEQTQDLGSRTVMQHAGHVILDVSGERRRGLDVPAVVQMFERRRSEALTDDAPLLC